MHYTQRPNRASRRHALAAYSLLEVVLASTLCASALVPALALMRDGIAQARNIDTRHLVLLYGVQKMEEQMPIVAALGGSWAAGSSSGDFAPLNATIRYNASWTDSPASGGLTGQLMALTVTTYSDDNGNDSLDASEPRTTLTTKVAKLSNYETLAGS